jgi:Tol biopolymer transport system component
LRISVFGGPHEPLPTLGSDPGFPSISRNGTRLAYATAAVEWHIWRVPLGENAGAVPEPFTHSSAAEFYPAPSPDGARIAFVSVRAGSTDIWLADSSGADLRRLTALGDRYAHRPRWSPDGNALAYFARSQDGPFRIFLVSAQGGTPRPLTKRVLDEYNPSWSLDGKWVYFQSRAEIEGMAQVWKAPAAGGLPLQVTKNGGTEPAESLDGKSLYYATEGSRRIVRTPLDGGEEITVVRKDSRTSWTLAPGGIYFLDRGARPKPAIEFFRFADGKSTRIVSLPKGAADYVYYGNSTIAVSPDGRWLYYEQRDKLEGDIMLVENFR